MTVLLNRAYGAYASGSVVELPASTESALIAQGIAQTSAAVVTAGAQSSNEFAGTAGIAIGASSVVVTNPWVTPNSKVYAMVSQAAADATLLRIERLVCAAGFFTIYGTANATAIVSVDWAILSLGDAPTL